MTELLVLTIVAAGMPSAWVTTDGYTNIAVKVSGGAHTVEIKDTEAGTVESTEFYNGGARTTIVAKAFKTRVINQGTDPINIQVNA